jgi:hypothetical protein
LSLLRGDHEADELRGACGIAAPATLARAGSMIARPE